MYANNLFNFFNDGRPAQTQAVLAYLSAQDGIEPSWDGHRYRAEPAVGHWEADRSGGYVITLKSADYRQQMNIVVATHPVGDQILVFFWEGVTRFTPTYSDIPESHPIVTVGYKMGANLEFEYGKADEAAAWIGDMLEEFWLRVSGNLNPPREQPMLSDFPIDLGDD